MTGLPGNLDLDVYPLSNFTEIINDFKDTKDEYSRLIKLRLFKKRRLHGNLIATSQYMKGAYRKARERLHQAL